MERHGLIECDCGVVSGAILRSCGKLLEFEFGLGLGLGISSQFPVLVVSDTFFLILAASVVGRTFSSWNRLEVCPRFSHIFRSR